jgi:hypothetical protein
MPKSADVVSNHGIVDGSGTGPDSKLTVSVETIAPESLNQFSVKAVCTDPVSGPMQPLGTVLHGVLLVGPAEKKCMS